jgi:hypothetical protein
MGKGTVKKGAKVFTMTSDGTIKEVGDTATFAATTTSKGGPMTFTGRTASYTTKDGKSITLVENSNGNWYSSDAVDFGDGKTTELPSFEDGGKSLYDIGKVKTTETKANFKLNSSKN